MLLKITVVVLHDFHILHLPFGKSFRARNILLSFIVLELGTVKLINNGYYVMGQKVL